jgi:hypothetical protein
VSTVPRRKDWAAPRISGSWHLSWGSRSYIRSQGNKFRQLLSRHYEPFYKISNVVGIKKSQNMAYLRLRTYNIDR